MTDMDTQQRIIEDLDVVADFDAARGPSAASGSSRSTCSTPAPRAWCSASPGVSTPRWPDACAQLACERVRAEGGDAAFVAIRLPYGVQKDEVDANQAVAAIAADEVYTVNIKGAVDAIWDACLAAGISIADERDDFVKGNVKARERMIAQYTVAGARDMLVVGTDQAAEAVVGFFTKYGDGAADLTPLYGLPKRRVRDIGRHLGIPENLIEKVPTADLEEDTPLIPDELALGVRYAVVDDYLEGGDVDPAEEATILGWYRRTGHKRALPVTPAGWEASRGA